MNIINLVGPNKCTKNQLMELLFATHTPATTCILINGEYCTLQNIEREDGSGKSFNLQLWNSSRGCSMKYYVRTID